MKSILLFSSIFYLLGLKIGHKIDLFKNNNPVEKISTTTKAVKQETKTIYFKDETALKCETDSLKSVEVPELNKKQENHF